MELFTGAGLIITNTEPEIRLEGKVTVFTIHAEALSCEIYRLKEQYTSKLDYLNKYEFYPTLGKAALKYLEKANDEEGLLQAVRNAAMAFEF